MTMRGSLIAALLWSCPFMPTLAAERCGVRSTAVAPFTVVPFAVPVAVPVATTSVPLILYRYEGLSPQPMPLPASATPAESVIPRATVSPAPRTAGEVIARHCAACHSESAPQGGLSLLAANGTLIERLPRQRIVEAVMPDESGAITMPPAPRTRLSADEVRLLREWARLPRDFVY